LNDTKSSALIASNIAARWGGERFCAVWLVSVSQWRH